jgi:hypothetical protein
LTMDLARPASRAPSTGCDEGKNRNAALGLWTQHGDSGSGAHNAASTRSKRLLGLKHGSTKVRKRLPGRARRYKNRPRPGRGLRASQSAHERTGQWAFFVRENGAEIEQQAPVFDARDYGNALSGPPQSFLKARGA